MEAIPVHTPDTKHKHMLTHPSLSSVKKSDTTRKQANQGDIKDSIDPFLSELDITQCRREIDSLRAVILFRYPREATAAQCWGSFVV